MTILVYYQLTEACQDDNNNHLLLSNRRHGQLEDSLTQELDLIISAL
jgi:hypothetical protein